MLRLSPFFITVNDKKQIKLFGKGRNGVDYSTNVMFGKVKNIEF